MVEDTGSSGQTVAGQENVSGQGTRPLATPCFTLPLGGMRMALSQASEDNLRTSLPGHGPAHSQRHSLLLGSQRECVLLLP